MSVSVRPYRLRCSRCSLANSMMLSNAVSTLILAYSASTSAVLNAWPLSWSLGVTGMIKEC